MSNAVSSWLEHCGCGRYADVFAENDVDFEVITELTDRDLEKLGVLGHRKKLFKSLEKLRVPRAENASPTDATTN